MSGLRKMELLLDELDYEAIQRCIALRQTFCGGKREYSLPDAGHDDCNIPGRVIAEICRGWEELLDFYGNRRNDRDGEEWKDAGD